MGKQSVLCSVLLALYLVHLQTVNAQQQWTIQRNKMDCIGQDGVVLPQIGANAEKLWPTSSYLPRGNAIRRMTGGAGLKAISTAGFSIEYYGTYKIIENRLVGEKYLLFHCGTAPPNVPGVTKMFQGPLTSASIADATAADFMTQITLMDRCAFASELAVSGCLQAISSCGYVAPGDDKATAASPIRANVDAFFIWGWGPSADPLTISFNAPSAPKPLERLKWIAYIAAFFNKEYAANAVYNAVRKEYLSLRQAVLTNLLQTPPLVCWVGIDWEGDYAMSFAQYKVEYIRDAGGDVWPQQDLIAAGMQPKPPGSTTTFVYKSTMTDVASYWAGVLAQCDVIVDESWEMSTGGLTQMDSTNPEGFVQKHGIKPYIPQVPAIGNKAVYTVARTTGMTVTNPNSPVLGMCGLDWFERGVSRADWVLRDLIQAIRPDVDAKLPDRWTRRFLLRLDGAEQQVRVPARCDLETAKLNPDCTRANKAARICPNAVRKCDSGVLEYPRLDRRCAAVSAQDTMFRDRRRQNIIPNCAASPNAG